MKLGLLLSLAIAVCHLLFPLDAMANDGAAWGVGGSVQMMNQHGSVRMVSERVDVTLYPDRARVKCRFLFRNEGRAVSVKMGFPESGDGDASPSRGNQFRWFKSWVDGKEVQTTYVQAAGTHYSGYTGWHTKIVRFAAKQQRIVRDEYESPLGGVADGMSDFSYILATGRSWKGPIGQGVIVVDASRVSPYGRTAQPNIYSQTKNKLVWKFKNTDRVQNIFVGFYNAPFVINGKPALPVWGSMVHGKPFIVRAGTRLVTARLFGEEYYKPASSKSNHTFIIARGSRSLALQVGKKTAILNASQPIRLPYPPILIDQQLLVPFQAVLRALGGTAKYEKRWKQTLITLPPARRRP